MNNIKLLQINLKSVCNLRCKYCAIPEISKNTYSDENKIILNLIFLLRKFTIENIGLNIVNIIGAEPLIVKPYILSKVINLFLKFNKNIKIYIHTNGTLATKEYMNILNNNIDVQNNISISWSIDGVRRLHNYWRDQSFDIAVKNLFYVAENFSFKNLVNIGTGSDHFLSKKNQLELLNFINKCKSYNIIPLLSIINYSLTKEGREKYSIIKKKLFHGLFSNFIIKNNLILNNIKNFNKNFCYREGNNCSKILFDLSTGNIYQCEKGFDLNKKPVSNFFNDSIEKIIKKRNSLTCNVNISEECMNCKYYNWCKSGCPLRRNNGKYLNCNIIKKVLSHIENNIQKDFIKYLIDNDIFINNFK